MGDVNDDIPTEAPETAPIRAPGPAQPPDALRSGSSRARRAIAIVLGAALVGGLGFLIGRIAAPDDERSSRTAATRPATSTPLTTPQVIPADPSASGLSQLGLREDDVAPLVNVLLIPDGNRLTGHPTLDMCNGTFHSETLRRARLQVREVDSTGNTTIGTESVLYANPAAAAQAFDELRTVTTHCPTKPVVSPVGLPTVTTKFKRAPDRAWPKVATVSRLAYDFESTDVEGRKSHAIAVYLRRGRAFTAVYFSQADSPPTPVLGHTTVASITSVFAKRLAALPRSVAGD